jgi:hypothetical protein
MATNNQLKLRASDIIEKAKRDYEQRLEPVVELMDTFFAKEEDLEIVRKLVPDSTWFCSLCYQTEKSWSCRRRVVTKVVQGSEGLKIRHVVTSLPLPKSLLLNFILRNIAREVKWRIELKSNN